MIHQPVAIFDPSRPFQPINPAAPKPRHHIKVALYTKGGKDMGIHSLFVDNDHYANVVQALRQKFPGLLIEDSWEVPYCAQAEAEHIAKEQAAKKQIETAKAQVAAAQAQLTKALRAAA